jgi:hypothetical protein
MTPKKQVDLVMSLPYGARYPEFFMIHHHDTGARLHYLVWNIEYAFIVARGIDYYLPATAEYDRWYRIASPVARYIPIACAGKSVNGAAGVAGSRP